MIASEIFGTVDNKTVTAYTLRNKNGMQIRVLDYGGILCSVQTPDRHGQFGELCLGYDDMKGYQSHPHYPYMGCIVGRFANRIANGRFEIDGTSYQVGTNLGSDMLHGGHVGFDKAVWKAERGHQNGDPYVLLRHHSPDGDQGFPGNMDVSVTYTLREDNTISIEYEAFTDKTTVVNLTNHAYFNLSAGRSAQVREHVVTILSKQVTETDESLIPTGKLLNIGGTPLDFSQGKTIGRDLELVSGGGYDHNYVLEAQEGNACVASVYEPISGRLMEMMTSEPALQLYVGIHLNEPETGRQGSRYGQYAGLCLEAQHYPDAPNHLNFPSTLLKPGETYRQTTMYRFSVL